MNKEKIWDFWAKRYEKLWVQRVSLEPTRREILLYLDRLLIKGEKYRILDVGCGIGQTLREIKYRFDDYDIELLGIDFSKEMIDRAKSLGDDICYQQIDVKDIHVLRGKFDVIICTHSFPYYEDQRSVIQKFRGLINDNGHLLLAQASQNNLYDSLAMFFVKFTTGKAKYPSVKETLQMTEQLFRCEEVIRIKERFYMPSIYFFILKGKG